MAKKNHKFIYSRLTKATDKNKSVVCSVRNCQEVPVVKRTRHLFLYFIPKVVAIPWKWSNGSSMNIDVQKFVSELSYLLLGCSNRCFPTLNRCTSYIRFHKSIFGYCRSISRQTSSFFPLIHIMKGAVLYTSSSASCMAVEALRQEDRVGWTGEEAVTLETVKRNNQTGGSGRRCRTRSGQCGESSEKKDRTDKKGAKRERRAGRKRPIWDDGINGGVFTVPVVIRKTFDCTAEDNTSWEETGKQIQEHRQQKSDHGLTYDCP